MRHKFENGTFPGWPQGFKSQNTILNTELYQPEVLIVGTFNHGWPWNPADFFYGRDMFMWTVMSNLFLHNANVLVQRRTANNNNPTLSQIFAICQRGKLAFADIVAGVKPNIPVVFNHQQQSALVNGQYIWKGYKDGCLDHMGNQNWLDDNVDAIVQYVNATPSIKHVYFTFKSGGWVVAKKNLIVAGLQNVASGSIFTPSCQGFGNPLPAPFQLRPHSLAHCWVWNGLHHAIPVHRAGYTHLNHDWLRRNGADPNNF